MTKYHFVDVLRRHMECATPVVDNLCGDLPMALPENLSFGHELALNLFADLYREFITERDYHRLSLMPKIVIWAEVAKRFKDKGHIDAAKEFTDFLPCLIDDLRTVTGDTFELRQYVIKGMNLRAYLNTPEWKRKRLVKLEQANNRCQKCGSVASLQVHHLTYARFGEEWDSDLIVVCDSCHRQCHGKEIPEIPEHLR
jgi:hypothetical protein